MKRRSYLVMVGLVAMAGILPACRSAYYGTMEKFGYQKRDLLVSNVEDVRDEQQEAKEQFRDALEQFSAVVQFEGGDLEEKYETLRDAYESSKAEADDVSEQIDEIERVAEDLFEEWEDELDQYSSADLRRASERQLRQTRIRYRDMLNAMERAEQRMQPVLTAFQDQVLFLKHNLNARAIASLEGNVAALEDDVARLIAEMEQAIAEADRFIQEMSREE